MFDGGLPNGGDHSKTSGRSRSFFRSVEARIPRKPLRRAYGVCRFGSYCLILICLTGDDIRFGSNRI